MTVSTKISGSEMNASSHGTPKNSCVTQAPSTLRSGTPTNEIQSGNSMWRSGSAPGVLSFFAVSDLNALVKISGLREQARPARPPPSSSRPTRATTG